jgi:hypothetical protein
VASPVATAVRASRVSGMSPMSSTRPRSASRPRVIRAVWILGGNPSAARAAESRGSVASVNPISRSIDAAPSSELPPRSSQVARSMDCTHRA